MLPVTFSPPGTAYLPSAEDALRDGILLMFKADDVVRKDMSYDEANEAKGVRIYAGPEPATYSSADNPFKLVVPQLMVTSAVTSNRWAYATGKSGEKRIAIIISLIEARDPAHYDTDTAAFRVTSDAKLARFEKVLMCGTIISADQDKFSPRVVDPYRSPLLGDGTYDLDSIKYLNELGPEISRAVALVGEDAVAYNLIAVYTVNVANREVMTEAGYS